MNPTIKHWSAWIPIALSLTVLPVVLSSIAMFGPPAREADVASCIGTCGRPDEGTGAHLFQLWLLVEAVMVSFFAIKWLPRDTKQALVVVLIQIVAILAACAPLFFFYS